VAERGYAHFWGQPGGAREQGESFELCAAREIAEETGLSGVDVGSAFASREFPLLLPSGWVQGVERYFLVRCEAFEPDTAALTESEASYVLGWKWWSKEEIAASNELIYPEALANMLTNVGVG
ncbi:MAG: NUDIX domain-containing protein, partial [Methylocystis sp.]